MPDILTENIIAEKAIEVIAEKPGINTSELILILQDLFELHEYDLEILEGRRDNRFSQKVRNLVSHLEGNFFGKHVLRGEKRSGAYTWEVNNLGREFANKKSTFFYQITRTSFIKTFFIHVSIKIKQF